MLIKLSTISYVSPFNRAYDHQMTHCPYTANDWRERAEKARAIAEQAVDPEARRAALEMAAGYEKLADMAAKGSARLAPA